MSAIRFSCKDPVYSLFLQRSAMGQVSHFGFLALQQFLPWKIKLW